MFLFALTLLTFNETLFDTPPNSLMDSTMSPKGENNERVRNWGTLPGSQHFEGKRACWSSGMGTRKSDKQVIPSHFPTLLGVWKVTLGLHTWPTPLQPLTLVTSPRLGLQHSPPLKEKVNVLIDIYNLFLQCNCFHLDPWLLFANFCGKTLPQANLSIPKFLTLS